MTNEQKKQINEAIAKLELADYYILDDNEYSEDGKEKVEKVIILEFNNNITFRFEEVDETERNGFVEDIIPFEEHSLYLKHMEDYINRKISILEEPEYIFDGKTVLSTNLDIVNQVADKLSIDSNDIEAREHLACKLEEHIHNKLNEYQEELF